MFTWPRNTTFRLTELDKSIGMRDRWMTVDPDTLWFNTVKNEDSTYSYTGTENVAMTFYAENTGTVLAAEYWKDNVIFACSDGYLYSAPINDMANAKQLIYWQDTVSTINDMSLKIKQSEKTQSEFISSVSHELRTPLTAITGWAETIQSGEEDGIAFDMLLYKRK